jgi:sortase A
VNERPPLRWLERSLWVTSLVLLGWVGFSLADGWLFQSRAEASLERAIETVRAHLPELPGEGGSAAPEAPSFGPLEVGDPLGRLEVPRLGLDVMVAEGIRSSDLRRGAGHLPGTPLPGDTGNVALAGHRDRHFRPLKDIAPGDEILLTTPQGTFRYRVEWTQVVEPTAVEVLDPTDRPSLTLVTCYPFYFVGNAPDRFIVRARQVGWRSPGAGAGEAIAASR